MRSAPFALALVACQLGAPASADVAARFIEGAPKDRFIIENLAACALIGAGVSVDMAGSAGGLIFDVTGAGAGVAVFQPFEIVEGADALAGAPEVRDGDTRVMLNVGSLAPGARIAFTIDVDDTIGRREITVSGAEIEGAHLRVVMGGATYEGSFSPDAAARARLPDCALR
jgi:hypothetical protein